MAPDALFQLSQSPERGEGGGGGGLGGTVV